MRIDQLNYLKTLYKNKSLSQTAEELYLNQPTLSRLLRNMENELGVELFNRSSRGIEPTAICQQLLPHVENILAEYAKMQTLIDEEKNQDVSGKIRISATSLMCSNVLLDITAEYYDSYPLVECELVEGYLSEITNHITQHKSDFGFLTVLSNERDIFLNRIKHNGLIGEFLSTEHTVVVLSADSPLAQKEFLDITDVCDMPFFMLKSMKSFVTPSRINSNVHYCLDRDSRNKMIIKQNGYTVLSPLEMVGDFYVEQGLLALRPFLQHDSWMEIELWLIYDEHRQWEYFEEDFLTLVRSYFQKIKRI